MIHYSWLEGISEWQEARTGAFPVILMLLALPAFLLAPARFAPALLLVVSLSFLSLLGGVALAGALVTVCVVAHGLTEATTRMNPGNARRAAFAGVWLAIHAGFFAAFQLPVPSGISKVNPGMYNQAGVFLFFSGIAMTFFRVLAYLHDRVRRAQPRLSLFDFLLYNFWFPQLLHGPLERPADAVAKLRAARATWNTGHLLAGGKRLLIFAFLGWCLWRAAATLGAASKKAAESAATSAAVAADDEARAVLNPSTWVRDADLATISEFFSAPEKMPAWFFCVVLHVITFGLYWIGIMWAHLTIGVARCFAFVGAESFNYPLLSASPREWWTRWNITVSHWLRDYCFTPIGGARNRFHLNTFITFVYCGLIHGLQWRFVAWGIWSGVTIAGGHWAVEKLKEWRSGEGGKRGRRRKPVNEPLTMSERAVLYLRRALTFHWAAWSGGIVAYQQYCGLRVLRHYLYLLSWPVRVWFE